MDAPLQVSHPVTCITTVMTSNYSAGKMINGEFYADYPLIHINKKPKGNTLKTPVVVDSRLLTLRHGYTRESTPRTLAEYMNRVYGLRIFSPFYAVVMGFPLEHTGFLFNEQSARYIRKRDNP